MLREYELPAYKAIESGAAVAVMASYNLVNARPAHLSSLINTVVVLTSSYPYAIDTDVPAMLWSSHGGQEHGRAIAEVLFGDTAPAGRLTQTWYRGTADLPDLLDYDIIAADATYLYFRGTPLFPFGHGLTYPEFEYTGLRISQGETVTVSVEVHNRGDRDSDEVVQLYTRQTRSRVKQPLRQLRGFRRIHVPAGDHSTVHFELLIDDLAYWDVVGERYVVETARHDIMVGRSSTDIRLTASIEVDGEHVASWHTHRPFPAINADAYKHVSLVDATKSTGDAVLATRDGAWIQFQDVTFAATHCTARLSSVEPGPATVTLRTADPIDGSIIATLTADAPGDRYVWCSTTAAVEPVTDPADLYVVFGSPGVCLRDLTFHKGGTDAPL